MTNYRVYFRTYTDIAVDVEADNADDAIDKAYDEGYEGLCAQCSGMGYGSNWYRDESDSADASEVVNRETGETEWREDA